MAVGERYAIKRVEKYLGAQAGELEAAATFTPRGGVLKTALTAGSASAGAGTVGGVVADRLGGKNAETTSTIELPKAFVLALMPEDLLVFALSPMMGRISPFARIPRGTYTAADLGVRGGVARRMSLRFVDGSGVEVDTKYIGMNRHNPKVIAAIVTSGVESVT